MLVRDMLRLCSFQCGPLCPRMEPQEPDATEHACREKGGHGREKNYTAQPLCIGGKAGIAEIISVTGTELVTVRRRELQLSHNLNQDL